MMRRRMNGGGADERDYPACLPACLSVCVPVCLVPRYLSACVRLPAAIAVLLSRPDSIVAHVRISGLKRTWSPLIVSGCATLRAERDLRRRSPEIQSADDPTRPPTQATAASGGGRCGQ